MMPNKKPHIRKLSNRCWRADFLLPSYYGPGMNIAYGHGTTPFDAYMALVKLSPYSRMMLP